MDSSSEEEGPSGSGEKGNSPPSAQEERSPGAQSQSPTPLPKGRGGQGASGGDQVEYPPPATRESSPDTQRVPTQDWFTNLRSKHDNLLQKQHDQYVRHNEGQSDLGLP